MRWAILTGEYPPQPGGVSDYTRLVGHELAAAGDAVTVYAPKLPSGLRGEAPPSGEGAAGASPAARQESPLIRRLPDHFGPRGLAHLDHALAHRPRPDRILIQYVPHAFGWKGMNVAFAAWVALRRRLAPVWVMFHEVAFPLRRWPMSHAALGAVTRITARMIAGAADRILVSVPMWGDILHGLCPRAKVAEWLPVPCNVGTTADPAEVAALRGKYVAPGGLLVGHFGTFGPQIAERLAPAAARVVRDHPAARLLLIGRGSEQFGKPFAAAHPHLADRVTATGELAPESAAAHLRACDLLLQPFPDGISTRRGSVMAGLANGVPIVTNLGILSEPFWVGAPGVAVAATPDPEELAAAARAVLALDPASRAAMGAAAAELYRSRFGIEHTIDRLRAARF